MEPEINNKKLDLVQKNGVKNGDCNTYIYQKLNVAGMDLKNRFVFINLGDNELCKCANMHNFFQFYQKLANKDVGLIVAGGVYGVCEKFELNKPPMLIRNQRKEYEDFVSNVHTTGCKILLNLKTGYGRLNDDFKILKTFNLSASFNQNYNDSRMICARASDQKVNDIITGLKQTAKFGREVGFDGVMIDGTLSELLGEFSCREFNKRVFGYFANIYEFGEKLVKEIVTEVENIPVFYRVNIGTFLEFVYQNNLSKIYSLQGVKKHSNKKDVLSLLAKLVTAGVDAFVIEVGCQETDFINNQPALFDEGFLTKYIDELIDDFKELNLKNKFNEEIKFVIDYDLKNIKSKNDYLFNITKNIYADEDFLIKEKTQKLVKKCIKCNKCIDFIRKYNKIACAINPTLTDNSDLISTINKTERIAIVGAGVAGIVCALTLNQRGYMVDLYEKASEINAKNKLCEVFGCDKYLKEYNSYLKIKILKNAKSKQINLKTNYNFVYDANLLKEYTTVIIATGAREKFFCVNGAVQKHVKSIYEILSSKKHFVSIRSVAIFVRSELSLKLAVYLAKQNKRVSLIIPDVQFLFDMLNANLTYYLYELARLGVDVNLMTRVKKIHEDSAEIIVNNKFKNKDFSALILNMKSKRNHRYLSALKTIDAELFIFEPELVPNNKLYVDLVKNRFKGKVYLIGDALEVGGLDNAVRTGYYVGKNI